MQSRIKTLRSFLNLRKDSLPKIIALLVAMCTITGGIHLSQPFYFGALALLAISIVSRGGLKLQNGLVLLLLLVCFFSLLINNPPSYFRAWQRFGVYIMVVLVVSPILSGAYSTQLRAKVLYYFMLIGIILSAGSFFAYFLGINLFERGNGYLDIGAGTFSGLMNHSMVLGPIAGLSGVALFATILSFNSPRRHLIIVLMALFCLISCLLAASRVAVGATGVACIFAIFRYYRNRMSKMVSVFVVLAGLLMATFPVWGGFTNFLVEKQQKNEEMGGAMFSRERKFTARILEFESSPVIGIGYNAINPEYDFVEMGNGQIEPGSSWLAVASMTGVIGLCVFLGICSRGLKRAWRIKSPFISSLLGGMLVFFFIHMIAEGYIFAPGSFLALLFWLIIAVIDGVFDLDKKTNGAYELPLMFPNNG